MSILDDVLTRLDHLEALTDTAGEATQANYLTLDPATGLVGANFSGQISAQGVILPAATPADPSVPDQVNRVSWTKQSNGAMVGAIYGYDGGGGNIRRLRVQAWETQPGDDAQLLLQTNDDTGLDTAQIFLEGNSNSGLGRITMNTLGGGNRTLMDGNALGFLGLVTPQNLLAQLFTFTINGLGAGVSVATNPVNFPTPFPTSAIGMVATVQSGAANNSGLYVTSCIPTARSTFAIDITNPALQNVTCAAIAWGT